MPSRKTKTGNSGDKLLRLLHVADLSSVSNLANWLSKRLFKHNLWNEWKTFRARPVVASLIQHVQSPAAQDYFIVLMEQHRFLANEYKRVQRLRDQEFYEETEGTGYQEIEYILAKDEQTRAKIGADMAQRRAEFQKQKELRRMAEELERLKGERERQRSRKPGSLEPVNWGAPMPAFNDKQPFGYSQATGQHRKKVLAFLKQVKAKPFDHVRGSGRGRPLQLYGVETNLLVLDQWLGKWLPFDPDAAAETIMNTLLWQASQEFDAATGRRFREILHRHWRRVRPKLTDPEVIKVAEVLGNRVFTDDQAWLQLRAGAYRARLQSEKAARR